MPSPRSTHDNAGIAANMDIKTKATIKSWADADAFLGKSESSKQLASNVTVERDLKDTIHVTLYSTRIVSYYPDETFSVNNGGFNTPTTSRRVTQFTPDGYVFWHHKKMLHTRLNGKKINAEGLKLPVNGEEN